MNGLRKRKKLTVFNFLRLRNPLSPKSDQHQIFPRNISVLQHVQVMRI